MFFKTMLLSLGLLLTLQAAVGSGKAESDMDGKKVLVVYFSRTGENYTVGNITKGNTAQNNKPTAEKMVSTWIESLKL